MPRSRSQSTKRGLILGIVGVLLGIGLVFGLSVAADQGHVDLNSLGDREFEAGPADSLAERIREDGPVFYPDVSGGKDRDTFVQHHDGEWYAIAAGRRACTLEWTGTGFTDPCTDEAFPPDGAGRTRYRTRVEGDDLIIDFTTEID